jgi:hypothetical protein
MKTHSADNYHVCQYPECGRRFTQESKLRAHIRSQHEKVRSLTICEILVVKEIYSNEITVGCWHTESRCVDREPPYPRRLSSAP